MHFHFLCLLLVLQVSSSVARRLDRTSADVKKVNGNDVGPFDPFTKIIGTSWSSAGGVTRNNCTDTIVCDTYVGQLTSTALLRYDDLDFQDGAHGMTIVFAKRKQEGVTSRGKIYFRLEDDANGPFAEVLVGDTGGDENWVNVNVFFEEGYFPTGAHNYLYVTFRAPANQTVGNIVSFVFYRVT